ncbi:SIR2 family protein [Haliangium sp.]|uniref:SIR2 family protein n=1 Tax=Haliangium sp. TaxID=2663208 RepID=UPI003D0AA5C0
MAKSKVTIPTELQRALREGRIIPFVGAGVSRAVTRRDAPDKPLFPSWYELLERGASELGADRPTDAQYIRSVLAIDEPKYLDAAKHLRDKMQGAQWTRFFKQHFDPRREIVDDCSLTLSQAIWQLGSRLVITTNYDRVLEWGCPEPHDLARQFNSAPAEFGELVRGGATKPTVWYLHGFIDDVNSLVLTPDGYHALYHSEERQNQHRTALQALKSLLASHCFLFIGFSLDDEHVATTLRGVFNLFQGYAGEHFALVRAANARDLKQQQLPVEAVTFENYPDLPDLVLELARCAAPAASRASSAATTTASISTAAASALRRPDDPDTNPFGAMLPIREPTRFIGREAELRELRRLLANGWVSLTAAPKIGKSSLLYQLAHTWDESSEVLGPLDLQGIEDINDFYEHLATALRLKKSAGWRTIRTALRARPLLMLLDELDCGPGRCLDSLHFGYLRSVVTNNAEFRVVTASRRPVKELFPDTGNGSPEYNYLQPLALGDLGEDAARLLLAHPWAPAATRFDEGALVEIIELAGRHPFWLQRAAYHRYRALRDPHIQWRAAWRHDRENML